MMSIEEEIQILIPILTHPAGFDVDFGGILSIRPIEEHSPPQQWEVSWEDENGVFHYQEFDKVPLAAEFFVKLRHQQEFGLDFEAQFYFKESFEMNKL